MLTDEEYKNMSVKEFTKAAKNYESDHAGFIRCVKKKITRIFWRNWKRKNFQTFWTPDVDPRQ